MKTPLPDSPYWHRPVMSIIWRQFSRSPDPVRAIPDPDPNLTRQEAGHFYRFASQLIERGQLRQSDLLPLNLLFIEMRRVNDIIDRQLAGGEDSELQLEATHRVADLLEAGESFGLVAEDIKKLMHHTMHTETTDQ